MFGLNIKSLLIVATLTLGGITAANAQIADGSRLTVNIPNSFVVNDKTFDAGVYTISRTSATTDSPSLLLIRGENGKAMIFDTIATQSTTTANATQLIFDDVNGTYFLSKIVVKGENGGNELLKTKEQKAMIARDQSTPRKVLTVGGAN